VRARPSPTSNLHVVEPLAKSPEILPDALMYAQEIEFVEHQRQIVGALPQVVLG
jgi:hypothetical protein